ncbi:MAG: IS1380 family transposase [Ardenticatenaceae bacterium]
MLPLSPDRIALKFDDEHAIAFAGLINTAMLAGRLGLRSLFETHIQLGNAAGKANAGHKAMTLVHSVLVGGECIDDVDALRAGATAAVLGHEVRAPSTVGTFLRSFTWGHVRQLDHVAGELLTRAWHAGAGPGSDPVTLDLDSTLCETYGSQKQGARVNYTGGHGYNPLLATRAGSGEVVHSRLRGGNAHSSRGAASFLAETFQRVRRAGATGALAIRADSGFYTHSIVKACRRAGVAFSITVRMQRNVLEVIEAIPDDAWMEIPYWQAGGAEVAETEYLPFRPKQAVRLIVLRTHPSPGNQLTLFKRYTYHAFITDRDGETIALEADHRRHAEVEQVIRELKYDAGLNHFPSGRFAANAAWLAFNVIAHNLAQWVWRLGLPDHPRLTTRTLRRRLWCVPGRLTRSARRWTLHLPRHWPWADAFLSVLNRLRAIPPPLQAR